MENNKKKILIISLSGLGDVLLFTPALHLLRKGIPDAFLTMLVKSKAAAGVLTGNPDIDTIEVFDPEAVSLFQNIRFYFNLRRQRYDFSISTFPALTALNNISTWVIGAQSRWTYCPDHFNSLAFLQNHTIPYIHGKHRVIYNIELAEALINHSTINNKAGIAYSDSLPVVPIDQKGARLNYFISPEEKKFAQTFLRQAVSEQIPLPATINHSHEKLLFIGIHPGSGGDQPFKRWAEEKFASLAYKLQTEYSAHIILLGGNEETEIAKRIASRLLIPPIIAAGIMDIRHTAALIAQCALLITNDSGLMHLAVAVGTKVIGIFGPTDETNTAPIGSDDKVVILPHLPCKADCRKRFLFDKQCPFQFRCLQELEIQHVLHEVKSFSYLLDFS